MDLPQDTVPATEGPFRNQIDQGFRRFVGSLVCLLLSGSHREKRTGESRKSDIVSNRIGIEKIW